MKSKIYTTMIEDENGNLVRSACTERSACVFCGRKGWVSDWPDGGQPNHPKPDVVCVDTTGRLSCGRCAQGGGDEDKTN